MQPLSTREFHFVTSAGPERVWPALIDRDGTVRYLHGLVLTAEWRAGGTVTVGVGGASPRHVGTTPGLRGEVITAEAPHRLSFALAADPSSPTTYVTWDVRTDASGTTVRLLIDELDDDEDDTEAQRRWLPVLHAVRDAVHAAAGSHSSPTPEAQD